MEGDDLNDESTSYKVCNSLKVEGDGSFYISRGVPIGTSIMRTFTAAATTAAIGFGATALKEAGFGLFALSAVVGVALGGYFTTKLCIVLIDKFEEYYLKMLKKLKIHIRELLNIY